MTAICVQEQSNSLFWQSRYFFTATQKLFLFIHALSLSWSLCQMTVVVHAVPILLEFILYKRLKNSLWKSLNREKMSPLDYSSLNVAEVI